MDEDDTETLERKLREKALQSMQRHAKSPEGQEENDDDWFAEKLTKGKNSKVETDRLSLRETPCHYPGVWYLDISLEIAQLSYTVLVVVLYFLADLLPHKRTWFQSFFFKRDSPPSGRVRASLRSSICLQSFVFLFTQYTTIRRKKTFSTCQSVLHIAAFEFRTEKNFGSIAYLSSGIAPSNVLF